MALSKRKSLGNGIYLDYHRVASIQNITNEITNIIVKSYISDLERSKELEYYRNLDLINSLANKRNEDLTPEELILLNSEQECCLNVLTKSKVYSIPYDQNMNVVSAYEYLKTLSEYEGSTDV